MSKINSYCDFARNLPEDNLHRIYHDTQYGFPISSDNELFGRLILEINQAGLSWEIILNKQDNFRKAFSGFDIQKIANYQHYESKKLLENRGIVRNKLKIEAIIYNAKKVVKLQEKHGSFKQWLDQYNSLNLNSWIRIFKQEFKFTGKEITNEFLISTGYLPGAHIKECVIQQFVIQENPIWSQK